MERQNHILALTLVPIAATLIAAGAFFYLLNTQGGEIGAYYALSLHLVVVAFLVVFKRLLPLDELLLPVWSIGVVLWASIHALALAFYGILTQRLRDSAEPETMIALSQSLQWCSLLVSLGLTVTALWVALRTRGNRDERPLRTLAMFVLFFLMVTFSLALALGLDDKVRRSEKETPGLHGDTVTDAPQLLQVEEAQACKESAAHGVSVKAQFEFQDGQPGLARGEDYADDVSSDTADCARLETASRRNECNLLRLRKAILCQQGALTVPVMVQFPADQMETSETREVASHRYEELRHAIGQSLASTAISREADYSSLPVPTYSKTIVPAEELDGGYIQVEVAAPIFRESYTEWTIQQGQLTLLDYIYFTVYTITTTGYGDIKPISSFAKFSTTLGNLYEFVFIVLVFSLAFSGSSRSNAVTPPPETEAVQPAVEAGALSAIRGETTEEKEAPQSGKGKVGGRRSAPRTDH